MKKLTIVHNTKGPFFVVFEVQLKKGHFWVFFRCFLVVFVAGRWSPLYHLFRPHFFRFLLKIVFFWPFLGVLAGGEKVVVLIREYGVAVFGS